MPKAEFIRTMFDDISGKYDLLNDILSFGTHRLWKRQLVEKVWQIQPKRVLDCATGTGDIAFMLEESTIPEIIGTDFSGQMIELAKQKAKVRSSRVSFEIGDLTELVFEKNRFDAASVSFGLRNVENLPKALNELSRVSNSLFVLEFGKPQKQWFAKFYFKLLRLYFPVFSFISGRGDAYDYLISSSESFPSGSDFIQLVKSNTDYQSFSFTPLFGGIAYIYEARK